MIASAPLQIHEEITGKSNVTSRSIYLEYIGGPSRDTFLTPAIDPVLTTLCIPDVENAVSSLFRPGRHVWLDMFVH